MFKCCVFYVFVFFKNKFSLSLLFDAIKKWNVTSWLTIKVVPEAPTDFFGDFRRGDWSCNFNLYMYIAVYFTE